MDNLVTDSETWDPRACAISPVLRTDCASPFRTEDPKVPLCSPTPATEGPKTKKVKESPKPAYGPDWEWSSYEEFQDEYGSTIIKKQEPKSTEAEEGPFRVIYRRRTHQLWPDVVQVRVSSVPLVQILQRYLPNDGELKSAAKPQVEGRHLFALLDGFKHHVSAAHPNGHAAVILNGSSAHDRSAHDHGDVALANHGLHNDTISNADGTFRIDGGNDRNVGLSKPPLFGDLGIEGDATGEAPAEGEQHLAHLVRFLEMEYDGITAQMQRMKSEKRGSWDMLWALLPRDSKVVYSCDNSGELLYAVVSATYYQHSPMNGWFFIMELEMWDYDGKTYRQCQIQRHIAKYDGERSFANLAVCPVEAFGSQQAMEAKFLENGKRFYDLAARESNRFMHYTGPMFYKRDGEVHKDNADGRVMIDQTSFAKMNPTYPMGTAKAQTDFLLRLRLSHRNLLAASQFCASEQSVPDSENMEQKLMFAPGIVYGFSFNLKLWGAFAVGGFQEVAFDLGSFRELVMEPDVKRLIRNLASQYIGPANRQDKLGCRELKRVDPISSKGEGCVFLCYGPPGSGKTLTAESLAESMQRPLWALSVSELGISPSELEQTLLKVLDIASRWRAVLLLDEADVFLEKRSSGADVMRNAMTGVFLRLLEYYKGVLFLTTNRIGTFDEAFRSRISVFLSYSKLGTEQKEQVWRTLLGRAGVDGVPAASIANFAAQDLNGREIRNVIHTAAVWAKSCGEVAAEGHVKYVIDITTRSLVRLNAALHNAALQSAAEIGR